MPRHHATLGSAIRKGAVWSYASQIFLTIHGFVVGVVMARLLGPAEFGVFIAVTAFTSIFLTVAQFGIPPALVQAKEITDAQKSAGFWIMLAFACLLMVAVILAAPHLAGVYHSKQFAPVMYGMCSVFFISAYASTGLALLRRDMRFTEVAWINGISSVVASAVGIGAALCGAGVYSLVLGAVTAMLATSYGISRALGWRPAWSGFRPALPLLRFAAYTTLNNVQDLAINRADNMIVGAVLGTGSLAVYNRAFSLARLPSDQFAESLGPLLLGAFSRVQSDEAWSRAMFLKAVSAISTVTLPFLAILLILGPQLVILIYGPEWSGAGPPLQVMVLGGYFVMLSALLQRLAYSQALVKEAAKVHLLVLVATVVLVLVAAPFGLLAIAWGITAREILWTALLIRLIERSRVALGFWRIHYASVPAIIATITAGGSALVLVEPGTSGLFLYFMKFSVVLFLSYGVVLAIVGVVWRSHGPFAATVALAGQALNQLRRSRAKG